MAIRTSIFSPPPVQLMRVPLNALRTAVNHTVDGRTSSGVALFGKIWESIQRFEYECTSSVGLDYLVDEFEEFERLFKEACSSLKLAAVSSDATRYAVQDSQHYISKALSDFDNLRATVKSLTPTHLLLQHHLQSFERAVPINRPELKVPNETYLPLCELRNRYFATPEPRLLNEYLELAEAVASRQPYLEAAQLADEEISPGALEGRQLLRRCAVDLEVISLLQATVGVGERRA
jgi:hypothetical protein